MRRKQLSTGLMDRGTVGSQTTRSVVVVSGANSQGGEGIMIWAGIDGDELKGPFRVLAGVNITSPSYCQLLQSNLPPWLDDVLLQEPKTFVFRHDNGLAHSAKATQHFLASLGIRGKRLMVWPPCSHDLIAIENLWAILKWDIYKDGK